MPFMNYIKSFFYPKEPLVISEQSKDDANADLVKEDGKRTSGSSSTTTVSAEDKKNT
jgi:hypothetical protein